MPAKVVERTVDAIDASAANKLDPQPVGEFIQAAAKLLKAGDPHGCKALLRRALAIAPDNFQVLYDLAFASDVLHEHEDFAHFIGKAVEVRPEHPQSWLYKGMSDAKFGRIESAEHCYAKAVQLDPDGKVGNDANVQLVMLRRNISCPLLSGCAWGWSSSRILEQKPRSHPVQLEDQVLHPPRAIFRQEHPVVVWDDALGPELLQHLRDSVDDLSTYLFRNPNHCRTFWLPRDKTPSTAAEVAGRVLLEKLIGLSCDDFVGIEWWCKHQTANLGAHFHYDGAMADGGLVRPVYSSVLYLADEGGPTVVLDQAADEIHDQWPEVPQEGYVVMPRVNRYMVFPGELRHGMVPIDGDHRPRWVMLYNFWATHKPGAPNCQEAEISSYAPVCATAVTSKYLVGKKQVKGLLRNEEMRPLPGQADGPKQVQVRTVVSPEECDWSSRFGEQDVDLPMPSPARLLERSGEGDARPVALHIPWRRLASVHQASLGANVSSAPLDGELAMDGKTPTCPLQLSARLPMWERQSALEAWSTSSFLTTAKELAFKAVSEAVQRGESDCQLGLVSLEHHLNVGLGRKLSALEIEGASTRARGSVAMAELGDSLSAIHATVVCALYEEISELVFQLVPCKRCYARFSQQHHFVMVFEGLKLSPHLASRELGRPRDAENV